jgi:hypothetical protein
VLAGLSGRLCLIVLLLQLAKSLASHVSLDLQRVLRQGWWWGWGDSVWVGGWGGGVVAAFSLACSPSKGRHRHTPTLFNWIRVSLQNIMPV